MAVRPCRRPAASIHPIDTWHAIVQHPAHTGLFDLLDDDVVFISPVAHTPQRGKVAAMGYLMAAFHVFFNPDFRYVRQIIGPSDAMLEFETTIDGVLVNGVDLIKWNDAGRVVEFKVMLRPLRAVNLIHEKMAAMLESFSRDG
ncbi:MAG: nuclear transport factor 2 family protein [Pseudoxanthomonas sp.]